MKTIIEPFKIKTVEPIKPTTKEERQKILKKAHYNLFNVSAEDVLIDLLTDSGTSAMSAKQWAGLLDGDEAYAGSRSFFRFENTIRKITGFKHIIPTHQGRASERIIFSVVADKESMIPNNTHFDTTRANIEYTGAKAFDMVIKEGTEPETIHPFKGNMDIKKLEQFLKEYAPARVPLAMITVTNNSNGGQPVSMENIKETKALCKKYNTPLFIDACRFAENAYFIKMREKGYSDKTALQIAQEMFSYADGATMSLKKDAFANIGGFLALNDDDTAEKARNLLILTEGFVTYGGLAGRDLEAIAIGLEEILNEDYLKYRIRTIEYFAEKLVKIGIPILQPAGGHAIYINAAKFLSHIPKAEFPGHTLACALYEEGGVRSCEIGSVMFAENAKMELVRLAIPRRVYTQSHIDYTIEVLEEIYRKKEALRGMKITWQPKALRHFTAHFSYV
ncbi:MAG: tryptophanase [Deltaproteobacteria bacterium]|nr:tryptophanase [Deltaproteobacteria bacterium]